MSGYGQITNFTAKDALTTGDPAKIVKGADIDAELSAIKTAIDSKLDSTTFFTTGTKLPFYQASAPSGWTDQAINDVALVAVTQASTNGGSTTGSWTISGLTATDAGHTHGPGSYLISTTPVNLATGGTAAALQGAYSVAGTSSSGTASITVASSGAWRPARAYVIICSKN